MKQAALKQPVKPSPRQDCTALRVLGIDPGFASTGLTVLERFAHGDIGVVHASVARSAPENKKERRAAKIRVSVDDSRRIREMVAAIDKVIVACYPQLICIEGFTPMGGRGMGSNAWKTAILYGVVHTLAIRAGIPSVVFLPMDVKRAFECKKGASKQEVIDAMVHKVPALGPVIARQPKGLRDHIADAAAHAYLGFVHADELRLAVGAF